MRHRLPLWTLLLIVLVAAIALGAGRMWSQSRAYRTLAEHHRAREAMYRKDVEREARNVDLASRRIGDFEGRLQAMGREIAEARAELGKLETSPPPEDPDSPEGQYRDGMRSNLLQRIDVLALTSSHYSGRLEDYKGIRDRSMERSGAMGDLADLHSRLARKYAQAASRPWAYVAPDPPEPSE